jgi:hypothetical protein
VVHLESSDAVTASVIEQSRSNLLESCPLSHRNTGLGGYNCSLEQVLLQYLEFGTELKLERV